MKTLKEAKEIFARELKKYIAGCATSYLTQVVYRSGPEGAKRASEFIADMEKVATLQELFNLVNSPKYKSGSSLPGLLVDCLFEVAGIKQVHIDYVAEGVAQDWNRNSYWGITSITSYSEKSTKCQNQAYTRLYNMVLSTLGSLPEFLVSIDDFLAKKQQKTVEHRL